MLEAAVVKFLSLQDLEVELDRDTVRSNIKVFE
jgi:hypothetical protein